MSPRACKGSEGVKGGLAGEGPRRRGGGGSWLQGAGVWAEMRSRPAGMLHRRPLPGSRALGRDGGPPALLPGSCWNRTDGLEDSCPHGSSPHLGCPHNGSQTTGSLVRRHPLPTLWGSRMVGWSLRVLTAPEISRNDKPEPGVTLHTQELLSFVACGA